MTNTNNEKQKRNDADITPEDLEILGDKDKDMDGGDDELMKNTGLDNTDADGTPLNEGSGKDNETGSDLDVPGSELDNADENIGEEDEENNLYSQSDNKD